MSAIEAGIYRKPNPACPDCKGRGVVRYVTADSLGRTNEVVSVRCKCTDAEQNRPALVSSSWITAQSSESHRK